MKQLTFKSPIQRLEHKLYVFIGNFENVYITIWCIQLLHKNKHRQTNLPSLLMKLVQNQIYICSVEAAIDNSTLCSKSNFITSFPNKLSKFNAECERAKRDM